MPPTRALSAALALLLLPTASGCHSAMTPSDAPVPLDPAHNAAPLKFERHNFAAYCYDTYGCRVHYNGMDIVREPESTLQPGVEHYGPDYMKNWEGAYLGIDSFPGPVEVSWKSKDGRAHKATIDLAQVFKDRQILHRVPEHEIAGAHVADPAIILIVRGATLEIYMRAHIPTREPQIPGNRYSDFRDDLVLAYRQSF